MKRLDVKRRDAGQAGVVPLRGGRRLAWGAADAAHGSLLVDEPCLLYQDGALKVAHLHLAQDTGTLAAAVQAIEYQKGYRTSGLKTASRIFGYRPRNELRMDFCSVTSLAREAPAQHNELCKWAVTLAIEFEKVFPEQAHQQRAVVGQVHKDWQMPGGLWTSGIVNQSTALNYHYDAGNFTSAWSAMVVMLRDMQGGDLVLPEYDVTLRFRNGSLLLFDGQGILHGNTKLRALNSRAYRYSVVYYALSRMRNCLSCNDEVARIRKVKTQRELKRRSK